MKMNNVEFHQNYDGSWYASSYCDKCDTVHTWEATPPSEFVSSEDY